MTKQKNNGKKEFEKFVEEKHWSTRYEPYLLRAPDVWDFIQSLLEEKDNESMARRKKVKILTAKTVADFYKEEIKKLKRLSRELSNKIDFLNSLNWSQNEWNIKKKISVKK